jgi:hypothetical protein
VLLKIEVALLLLISSETASGLFQRSKKELYSSSVSMWFSPQLFLDDLSVD